MFQGIEWFGYLNRLGDFGISVDLWCFSRLDQCTGCLGIFHWTG